MNWPPRPSRRRIRTGSRASSPGRFLSADGPMHTSASQKTSRSSWTSGLAAVVADAPQPSKVQQGVGRLSRRLANGRKSADGIVDPDFDIDAGPDLRDDAPQGLWRVVQDEAQVWMRLQEHHQLAGTCDVDEA